MKSLSYSFLNPHFTDMIFVYLKSSLHYFIDLLRVHSFWVAAYDLVVT